MAAPPKPRIKIRTAWDEEKEEWYFSVQDVVAVLSESTDPKQYIKKMRARDPQLSASWGTICTPVQMLAADGKQRKVQAANTEGILRIIQSIPSPKAEPFKRWLAQVGRERIKETIDPGQARAAASRTPALPPPAVPERRAFPRLHAECHGSPGDLLLHLSGAAPCGAALFYDSIPCLKRSTISAVRLISPSRLGISSRCSHTPSHSSL